ncbi:MAG: 50S ribosomal protein L17 [Haliscomenobacter sp.]|nr:50S ribosomal protein L17 [Haliscomenobacter sp.]
MNHGNKLNHLGRKSAHRKALLRNLTISLIMHKRITTTEAKAKALRVFAEPLFTKSKNDSTHNRRVIFSYLQNKEALIELFATVAPAIANRPGGYLRVVKLGFRKGDAADIAIIELVDFNEVYKIKSDTSKSTGRRGRRGKGSAAGAESSAVVEDAVMDADDTTELENKD